ncbi:MAG: [FeFe] hydrogenase H-cluster maturation GTPase HydF [bacterium]
MQETPQANRPHIAVLGRRNVGKSSLINALTNQKLALVSDVPGTTADPVYKSMELLPLGPVVMIDTAGIDDTGSLGELRVKKTHEVLRRADLAVMVITPDSGVTNYELDLYEQLTDHDIPVVFALNKLDQAQESTVQEAKKEIQDKFRVEAVAVSAQKNEGIEDLREKITQKMPRDFEEPYIIGDLIEPQDIVVLVTPIDAAAPKGRLILPQVQTIRDILDHEGIATVSKEGELKQTLKSLENAPRIVVTDSQAFGEVSRIVPQDILLTSFSILFARYKGDMEIYLQGVKKLEKLTSEDKVLIAEACTHRRQDEDIGTVKIPNWLREKVGQGLEFDFTSGREYPDNLNDYDLVIHCGGCMLNRKEIISRLQEARASGVPIINYGMTIAQVHGILDRALKPFPHIYRKYLQEN